MLWAAQHPFTTTAVEIVKVTDLARHSYGNVALQVAA